MYCVYLFQHKQNNKIYVGRTKNFQERLGSHVRTAKSIRAHKTYFHKALNKYGLESFNYFVIEEFEIFQECCEAESFWIAYFESNKKDIGYNLSAGGETNIGVIPTLETRKKLSLANKGKHSGPLKKETKLKISLTKKRLGSNRGERNWNTSLTDKAVGEIKGALILGASSKYIMEKYGLSKSTVAHIKSNRSWNYIQPIVPTEKVVNMRPAHNTLKGSKNNSAKLNEDQVRIIKKLLINGEKIADVARKFSVTWNAIKSIKTGLTWSHIEL